MRLYAVRGYLQTLLSRSNCSLPADTPGGLLRPHPIPPPPFSPRGLLCFLKQLIPLPAAPPAHDSPTSSFAAWRTAFGREGPGEGEGACKTEINLGTMVNGWGVETSFRRVCPRTGVLDVVVVVGTGGDGAISVGELVVVLLAGAVGALLSSPRIFWRINCTATTRMSKLAREQHCTLTRQGYQGVHQNDVNGLMTALLSRGEGERQFLLTPNGRKNYI